MEQQKTILLNVYDIHDSNAVFSGLGLGFYHSGIEVSIEGDDSISYEYSFSTSGISRTAPRLRAFGVLRNSIIMGTVKGSAINIHKLISHFGRTTFSPGTYDLINNNCNHFTDAVCYALLEVHIPSWVNRFAYLGSTFFPPSKPSNLEASVQANSEVLPAKSGNPSGVETKSKNPPIRRRDNIIIDDSESPLTEWICGLPFQIPLFTSSADSNDSERQSSSTR